MDGEDVEFKSPHNLIETTSKNGGEELPTSLPESEDETSKATDNEADYDSNQGSGCVTPAELTDDYQLAASEPFVLEKTELEPILEDEVLELDTCVEATEDLGQAPAVKSTPSWDTEYTPQAELPPLYEEEENGDIPRTPAQQQGDTLSLAQSHMGGDEVSLAPDFPRRLLSTTSQPRPEDLLIPDGDDEGMDFPSRGAPNGGYGWVIVIAAFFCYFITEGISVSFGVFYGPFIRAFGTSNSTAAWIGSSSIGCSYLVGPLVGAVVNKFSCRVVALAGFLVGTVAFTIAALSQNFVLLIISWGIMGGSSFGMVFLPAAVSLGMWFDTRRGLATGLGAAGGGVGTFVVPPLLSAIISMSDWRIAAFVAAGLMLVGVVFGALLSSVPDIQIADSMLSLSDIDEEDPPATGFHNPGKARLRAYRKPAFSINSTAANSLWRLSQENIGGGTSHYSRGGSGTVTFAKTSAEEINTLLDQSRISLEKDNISQTNERNQTNEKKLNSSSYRNFLMNFGHPFTTQRSRRNTVNEGTESATTGRSQTSLAQSQVSVDMGNSQVIAPSDVSESEVPNDSKLSSYTNFMQHFIMNQRKHSRIRHMEEDGQSAFNSHAENLNDTKDPGLASPTGEVTSPRPTRFIPPRRPLRRKDIFYSGSTLNLERAPMSIIDLSRSQPGFFSKVSVMAPEQTGSGSKMGVSSVSSLVLADLINFKLLKQMSFLLYVFVSSLYLLGLYTPFCVISQFAEEQGVSVSRSSMLISLIGVTNTVGRVVSGIIGDRPNIDPALVTATCLLCCGLLTIVVPLLHSYAMISLYCLLFGFFAACVACLRSIVLVSLVGLENLTSAFGILLLFQGLASTVGLPLAGLLSDISGSFDLPFYAAGACFLLSGVICLPLRYLMQWELRRFLCNPDNHYVKSSPIRQLVTDPSSPARQPSFTNPLPTPTTANGVDGSPEKRGPQFVALPPSSAAATPSVVGTPTESGGDMIHKSS